MEMQITMGDIPADFAKIHGRGGNGKGRPPGEKTRRLMDIPVNQSITIKCDDEAEFENEVSDLNSRCGSLRKKGYDISTRTYKDRLTIVVARFDPERQRDLAVA